MKSGKSSKPKTAKPRAPKIIPEHQWKWLGVASHFICGEDCRFHMATIIGDYLVSTVGSLLFDSDTREALAKSRGIKLKGKGDQRRAEYMSKVGYEDIGVHRKYETMVFKAGKPCRRKSCGCGAPSIESSELMFEGYNNPGDATKGHMRLCYLVASGKVPVHEEDE